MSSGRKIWLVLLPLGLGGLALFITLVVRHGTGDIFSAVAAAGWGVAAVVAFHVVPLLLDVLGWRALIPPSQRLEFRRLLLYRWIGDSVSAMLPVAQVGGEIVRVRLASMQHHPRLRPPLPASIAAATVLVGMTVSVATQVIFTLSGLAIWIALYGRTGMLRPILLSSLLGTIALAGFYLVQRVGIVRILSALVAYLTQSERWQTVVLRGADLDRQIRAVYDQRRALIASCAWTMGVWATGAVEIWIALRALGLPGTYSQSYILESMSQGIRSAAFLVPGALGVQEGGLVVVGGMLGIPPQTALALALIRRVRELAFGLPGLIAWQWLEARRLLPAFLRPAPLKALD